MPIYVSEVSELLDEWDYKKNNEIGILPENVSIHSGKKVFWLCKKCGYGWPAIVDNRSKGHGCRECGKKRREANKIKNRIAKYGSLEDWCLNNRPWGMILLDQWDCKANGDKSPTMFTAKSSELVAWKCEKGHAWSEKIQNRVSKKYGCPFCSNRRTITGENDFATLYPDIAKEWDYDKNGNVKPSEISYGTDKSYWWKCSKCGRGWPASPNNRTSNKNNCPYCSHHTVTDETSLAARYPELLKEWDFSKNREIDPNRMFPYSKDSVWWKCEYCNHEWEQRINLRTAGSMCPNCIGRTHTSFPEQAIFYYVSKVYNDAIIHYTDPFCNKMEIDIYIPSIHTGIEYDGAAWHNSKEAEEREKHKYQICIENGIKLIRIREQFAYSNLSDSCDVCIIADDARHNLTNLDAILDKLNNYISLPKHDCASDEYIIKRSYFSVAWKNNLLEKYPDIASEWDYEKNGGLHPNMFFASSSHRAWWRCKNGHTWQTEIYNRTKGCGCKYCANQAVWIGYNDLETKFPGIAMEWDYEKNMHMEPKQFVYSSSKRVWWKCSVCGNEWPAIIRDRTTKGTGCNVCSNNVVMIGRNDFATEHPELLAQWDYEKNGNLLPSMFVSGSTQRIWWKCDKGHSWPAEIRVRVRGNGCRYCSGKGKKILNIETGEVFEGPYAVAQKYGCSYSAITNCCTGKTKRSCGYHWKYLDE